MGHLRTHYTNQCTIENVGHVVTLNGWVHRRRDLGGLIFIDLRDRYGLVQVVFNPEVSPEATKIADQVRSEYVISVTGKLVQRAPENINPKLETGQVEIIAENIYIFNEAKTPPFQIEERVEVDEAVRLKYRYIDLRRPKMQQTFVIRHRAMQWIRRFLDEHGFLELETPMLIKSTPEGARDFLVPSRMHKGNFYALPQSPQLFKQLFMVAGMERYFQFARCFRDEDLRADRQPEFTQVDIEVSFMSPEELMELTEEMMAGVFKTILGIEVERPFPRFTYHEVMERFGTDKPDLRFGMELVNVSEIVKDSSFKVFAGTIQNGGQVKAINAKGCAHFTRKEIDQWGKQAEKWGAKGLAWLAFKPEGIKGSIAKFLSEEEIEMISKACNVETGDLLFFVADKPDVVAEVLGNLRLALGKELGLIDESQYRFCWVTDFPLFEYSEEDGRYYAKHHPFTRPIDADISRLETEPDKVLAKAYDLVLNGYEIGGGSQRIYETELQKRIFSVLGIKQEEAKEKFGFLLEALEYGAPPHAGLALGFDRIVMLLAGVNNLRECIAFPKTTSASCLLTEAPSPVDKEQLDELHIQIKNE